MSATLPAALPTALEIAAVHDRLLVDAAWPQTFSQDGDDDGLWPWVLRNHRHNSLLWAEEDLARRRQVADAEIAANKRAIDGHNQARNDATERIDELLLIALGWVDADSARTDSPLSRVPSDARLNSETAGSIMDRMSIMALKVHAMRQQTLRRDVDAEHLASSQVKLLRLQEQRGDLGRCLDELLADARAGRAYFKIYRQFKMYNDPRFNPALVAERRAAAEADCAGHARDAGDTQRTDMSQKG